MELKSFCKTALDSSLTRSNRTFMELKLLWESFNSQRARRSNRTFMELKWLNPCFLYHRSYVLIAPLWN